MTQETIEKQGTTGQSPADDQNRTCLTESLLFMIFSRISGYSILLPFSRPQDVIYGNIHNPVYI
jgi:hypothetical protein